MTAGFLDQVVSPEQLQATAESIAGALTKIDLPSHASTKHRLRRAAVEAVRNAINAEITLEAYQRRSEA
jgi:enoyl-CoA hydratase